MNLSRPINSVIPSGHGAVLSVLARTERPLSGRTVAELTDGQVSRSRTNDVLSELTSAGLVLREEYPPAKLYVLNRSHVAAEAIVALAQLRDRLLDRMRIQFEQWPLPPVAAWLFGSFARGEGDARSEIDMFIVRPDTVDADEPRWTAQLDAFTAAVSLWSGNGCSAIDYSNTEFANLCNAGERIAADLRRDGILLSGRDVLRSSKPKARR